MGTKRLFYNDRCITSDASYVIMQTQKFIVQLTCNICTIINYIFTIALYELQTLSGQDRKTDGRYFNIKQTSTLKGVIIVSLTRKNTSDLDIHVCCLTFIYKTVYFLALSFGLYIYQVISSSNYVHFMFLKIVLFMEK